MVTDVVSAVDEACQNIIRHGYGGNGEIVLEIRRNGPRQLEVQLIDFAPPVDLAKIRPRCLDDVRPGASEPFHADGDGRSGLHAAADRGWQFLENDQGNPMKAHFSTRRVGATAVVALRGEIDLQNSPALRKELLGWLADRQDVVVDLSRVDYIDSSGIASLVEAYQTGGIKAAISAWRRSVLRRFGC